MLLIAIAGLILLELIIQPLIHMGGGHVLILPIFMLMAGAYRRWYIWAIYLVALMFISFFIPISPLVLTLLVAASYGLSIVFSHFVSETWIQYGLISSVLALIITIPIFLQEHHLSFPIFGSIILNMLILGTLFWGESKRA